MKKPEYFDALEEFKAGRYQYSEALGFGKFNYCYFSEDYCLFSSSDVLEVNENLPSGCFVPHGGHIMDWSEEAIGEDWMEKPEIFWKTYIVKTLDACDDPLKELGGVLITSQYEGWREREGPDDLLTFPRIISRNIISPHRAGEVHCFFLIPVFFTSEFYKANR